MAIVRGFIILAITFGMALLFAIAYDYVFRWSLAKDDLMYGSEPFQVAGEFIGLCKIALIAGALVFPVVHFAMRDRPLHKASLVIIGTVLLEIALVTPFSGLLGFLGSFAAVGMGAVAAKILLKPLQGIQYE